jgi:hypothetical protein
MKQIKKVKTIIEKERKMLDAKETIESVSKHSMINFTHGLLSGLAIAMIASGNYILIGVCYYIFKRFDSIILNREKYTTKFGQDHVFPIPSTLGFMVGCWISSIIGPYLK